MSKCQLYHLKGINKMMISVAKCFYSYNMLDMVWGRHLLIVVGSRSYGNTISDIIGLRGETFGEIEREVSRSA